MSRSMTSRNCCRFAIPQVTVLKMAYSYDHQSIGYNTLLFFHSDRLDHHDVCISCCYVKVDEFSGHEKDNSQ